MNQILLDMKMNMEENKNNQIYIGCDNGLAGGLAVIQGRKILELLVMPVIKTTGTRGEYDIQKIVEFLKKYASNSLMIIEKAHAMPKLGTVQAFSFGKLYGIMIGIASALKIPYTIVHSRTWQKEMFRDINSKDTKSASIKIAKQLYPNQSFLATERCKKPHDGMTDSLLIATSGQRHNL